MACYPCSPAIVSRALKQSATITADDLAPVAVLGTTKISDLSLAMRLRCNALKQACSRQPGVEVSVEFFLQMLHLVACMVIWECWVWFRLQVPAA